MVHVLKDDRTFAVKVDSKESSRLGLSLYASALLTACGGGGGGSGRGGAAGPSGNSASNSGSEEASETQGGIGSPGSLAALANTSTASGYLYKTADSSTQAARFLLQAQNFATDADIADLRSRGYLSWLASKFDAPPAQTGWDWLQSKPYKSVTFDNMVWSQLMGSPAPLRMRLALALSEIFVVSGTGIGSNWPDHMMAQYWDTLVAGVNGTYRSLLGAITLNPAMGYFLNTKGNQKSNGQGREPDENYAREVMQLMSIGLYQLDAKGNAKLASDGSRIPTFTQVDVTNLARVFTGYDVDIAPSEQGGFTPPGQPYSIESNGWTTRPMKVISSLRSTRAATFLGTTVQASEQSSLNTALDRLANHANTGPFICKQLIQRLVTSNPSPDFVGRVAAVFADNGAGVRGDMKSVFAAILLDNEARSPSGLVDPNFGALREPMLRLVQWARTFGVTSARGTWGIGTTDDVSSQLAQSPLRPPSVFNYFRPGYASPSKAMEALGMVAPEFQLVNEVTVCAYLNFMQMTLQYGFNNNDVQANYAREIALAMDVPALVDRVNLLLTGRQLEASTVELIQRALDEPSPTALVPESVKLNRVCGALMLVFGCSEYLVQK